MWFCTSSPVLLVNSSRTACTAARGEYHQHKRWLKFLTPVLQNHHFFTFFFWRAQKKIKAKHGHAKKKMHEWLKRLKKSLFNTVLCREEKGCEMRDVQCPRLVFKTSLPSKGPSHPQTGKETPFWSIYSLLIGWRIRGNQRRIHTHIATFPAELHSTLDFTWFVFILWLYKMNKSEHKSVVNVLIVFSNYQYRQVPEGRNVLLKAFFLNAQWCWHPNQQKLNKSFFFLFFHFSFHDWQWCSYVYVREQFQRDAENYWL